MTIAELKKGLKADAVYVGINNEGCSCYLHYGRECYIGFGESEFLATKDAVEKYRAAKKVAA